MAWLKQLGLSWIILSAAAICASCQELTSTLREGNRTCPGEEVFFTCTITSTSSVFALAWSSTEYIGQSDILQFSTAHIPGAMNQTSSIDENVTAMLKNNTNVNGVRILEITLRIVANVASEVTCSGTIGDAVSIEFSISAVPGIPQGINAEEIARPTDICIILVTWDLPANSAGSDIDLYIVYVPSRNISDAVSSTISTLRIRNCGDDLRVQVAAMNRVGCVGMNSPAVQPNLFPMGGSATTTSAATTTTTTNTAVDRSLSVGGIVGITIVGTALVVGVLTELIICYIIYRKRNVKEGVQQSDTAIEMETLKSSQAIEHMELKQEKRMTELKTEILEELRALKQQHTEAIEQMELKQEERVTQLEHEMQKHYEQVNQNLSSTLEELKQQQTKSLGNTSSPWHVPDGQRHAAKPASHNLCGKGVSGDSKPKPVRKSKSLLLEQPKYEGTV